MVRTVEELIKVLRLPNIEQVIDEAYKMNPTEARLLLKTIPAEDLNTAKILINKWKHKKTYFSYVIRQLEDIIQERWDSKVCFNSICPSGKVLYMKKQDALTILKKLQKTGRSEKGAYKCVECNHFHLTKRMNWDTPLTIKPGR